MERNRKNFDYQIIEDSYALITGATSPSKKVIIPSKIDGYPVTHIGNWAFEDNQLRSVEIPNSVTHIGDGAFRHNQLRSVEIPNSVTHIGNWAFEDNQLRSVEIPNSVTHIGDGAFRHNQLRSVEIPNSVTHIGNGAFQNNQLQSVEIPNSVTHIGDGAFRHNQLRSVEIPNSVTHIGSWAFENNQLRSVEIPNSVTHIGNGAFENNLEVIQGNKKIQMIDYVATIIRRKKRLDEFTIYSGQFFNTKQECYVAKRGDVFAHGDNAREAIEDVNFKFLQEIFDEKEIVDEINEKQTMSVNHFRILTGACRAGCKNFLNQNNVKETELPLPVALKLIEGQYGWSKISEYFKSN